MLFIHTSSSNGPSVALPDGTQLFVKPDCHGISRDLFIDPVRERLCGAFLDTIRDSDVVVDIGANIGFYALRQSRRVGPNGRVFAIEPADQNRYWLEKNISANRCENVSICPLAIGDRTGNGLIYINRKSNLTNMLGPSFGEVIATQDVKMSTLDDFLAGQDVSPDFIRMDVEGYEYNVLMGALKTLRAPKDMRIMMEFHPDIMGGDKAVDVLQTLQKLGFEIELMAFDDVLYPDVKPGSLMHFLLHPVWCALVDAKDPSIFCKVISGMTIRQLINDTEVMSGRFGCPNILFRKRGASEARMKNSQKRLSIPL